MQVQVQIPLEGGAMDVTVAGDEPTVSDLKQGIFREGGPPPALQKLQVGGRQLLDADAPLKSVVAAGEAVQLVKLRPPRKPQVIAKHRLTGDIVVVTFERGVCKTGLHLKRLVAAAMQPPLPEADASLLWLGVPGGTELKDGDGLAGAGLAEGGSVVMLPPHASLVSPPPQQGDHPPVGMQQDLWSFLVSHSIDDYASSLAHAGIRSLLLLNQCQSLEDLPSSLPVPVAKLLLSVSHQVPTYQTPSAPPIPECDQSPCCQPSCQP